MLKASIIVGWFLQCADMINENMRKYVVDNQKVVGNVITGPWSLRDQAVHLYLFPKNKHFAYQ